MFTLKAVISLILSIIITGPALWGQDISQISGHDEIDSSAYSQYEDAFNFQLRLDPDEDDEYWSDKFFHSGLSFMEVEAITVYNGDLIVGGNFLFADGKRVNRIARWDGNEWHGLGGGMDYTVEALTVYDGKLIAAGIFDEVDGQDIYSIAAWDGSSWSPIGEEFNDFVRGLAVFNGNLIAAGQFDSVGTVYAKYVAEWDGESWNSIYTVTPSFWVADAGTVFGGYLYGINVRGPSNQRIVRWDGTDWETLPSSPFNIHSMVGYNGELVIGGFFSVVDGVAANNVAAWDGTSWHPLGDGLGPGHAGSPSIRALFEYNGLLIAGGDFIYSGETPVNYIAQWNGTSWSPLGYGASGDEYANDGIVLALGEYNNSLITGGYFTGIGSIVANHIAAWDGSQWEAISSRQGFGVEGDVYCFTEFDGNIVAGGEFSVPGNDSAINIAQWTGISWEPLGQGVGGYVKTLIVYNNELYIGGWFNQMGGESIPYSGVLRWDGEKWDVIGEFINVYGHVLDFEIYNGDLIACGSFADVNGISAGSIARWDGAGWNALGEGISGMRANRMTVFDGSLVVVGDFTEAGGIVANDVAVWDGTSWSPIGANIGADMQVNGVEIYNGQLVIGGDFTHFNDIETGPVVIWDGNDWVPPGGVPLSTHYWLRVKGIAVIGNDLYAFGRFPDDAVLNNIARWDGTAWRPLGSGINPCTIGDLYVTESGGLFVGGGIYLAGGKEAANISRWSKRLCGDVTNDNSINIIDIVYLIDYLIMGGPAPEPLYTGDINGNGAIEIDDITYLIYYVYSFGEPPVCL